MSGIPSKLKENARKAKAQAKRLRKQERREQKRKDKQGENFPLEDGSGEAMTHNHDH